MYQGKNFMQANKRERKIKYMKEWKGHQTSKKGILGFKKPQKQLDTATQMFFQLFKLNIFITFERRDASEHHTHEVFRLGPKETSDVKLINSFRPLTRLRPIFSYHIQNSQLICNKNQLTSFYNRKFIGFG